MSFADEEARARIVIEAEDRSEQVLRDLNKRYAESGKILEEAMTRRHPEVERKVREHTQKLGGLYHGLAEEVTSHFGRILTGAALEEGMRESLKTFAEFEREQTRIGIATGATAH